MEKEEYVDVEGSVDALVTPPVDAELGQALLGVEVEAEENEGARRPDNAVVIDGL